MIDDARNHEREDYSVEIVLWIAKRMIPVDLCNRMKYTLPRTRAQIGYIKITNLSLLIYCLIKNAASNAAYMQVTSNVSLVVTWWNRILSQSVFVKFI
jgi:hypothetical protein